MRVSTCVPLNTVVSWSSPTFAHLCLAASRKLDKQILLLEKELRLLTNLLFHTLLPLDPLRLD